MKAKTQHRALLMSALSLFLCISMLVGTTFAWFTDEVTSGQNTIAAGNLDVELYYTASADVAADPNSNEWLKVESTTNVFGYDNWEPGFTKVMYFKIVNEGSLALKYKLAADVYSEKPGTNQAGKEFNLSDHLRTAVVPIGSTRDQILAMNGTKLNANFAMGNGTLVAKAKENGTDKATAVVGLAIWMPTTVGNTANHDGNAPEITFGINLLATQFTSEQDSFDANYDEAARYPAISLPGNLPSAGNTEPAEDMLLKTMDGVSTQIPAELVESIGGEYTSTQQLHLTHTEPVFDAAAKTVSFGNIDIVDENGNVIELEAMNNTIPITVVVPVGDAFAVGETVIIYHDGEPVASAVVDADKNVQYTVLHFCEVVVSAGDGNVDTAVEFAAVLAQGGNITLSNDITVDGTLEIPTGVEVHLDLNGKTLSGTAIKQKHVLINYGTLTVSNGTISSLGDDGGSTIVNKGTLTASNVTLNGAPFVGTDGVWFPSYAVNNSGTMTITDSVITAQHGGVASTGGEVTLNNVNVTAGKDGITNAAVYTNGGEVIINGGTYTNRAVDQNATGASVINGDVTVNAGTFNGRIENYYGTPVIKGGTFTVKPAANFVAPDYKVVNNDDGTFAVVLDKVSVTTAAELNEALAQGGKIALTADITATETIVLSQDVEVILDLGGHTLAGQVDKLLELKAGNVTIQNGTIRNVHGAATDTKYSIYMSGNAQAKIQNVTIETTGIGVYMTDYAHITELNADISSYITVNGYCTFDAVCMVGNAKIDLISGGTYKTYFAESMFEAKLNGQSMSYNQCYTINLNSAGAYIGEIRGGTFIGAMDTANNGTPIHVNNGTVELISGGYFGFAEKSFTDAIYVLYANTSNGGKINRITGGTYEKGIKPVNNDRFTGYGCDFENIVAASGCKVELTGNTVIRGNQLSTKVKESTLDVVKVVPQ